MRSRVARTWDAVLTREIPRNEHRPDSGFGRAWPRGAGSPPLEGPRGAGPHPVHARPRHHRGERRAAADPARPGVLAVRAGVGGQRLRAHGRRPVAARRAAGRHPRPAAALPARRRGVRDCIRYLRGSGRPGHARGIPIPAGRGRGHGGAGLARPDRPAVPRSARADEGARPVGWHRRARRHVRHRHLRRAGRPRVMAVDLLRQPAGRPLRARDGAATGLGEPDGP